MGTYKVIQDIEADDKLIGWMSPRQAIYAVIVAVSGFICFFFATHGAWWAALPMLPHMILFTVLAGPFMHDQPVEVWLLARIQFALKPRKRIWNQSGVSELVTVTAPKRVERQLTDGLSQIEVKSRLQALANTIDTRGWAVKNIGANPYQQPAYAAAPSDRLLELPGTPAMLYVEDHNDILDESTSPTAQNLDRMMTASAQAHRAQVMQTMQHPHKIAKKPADDPQWFVQSDTKATSPTKTKTAKKSAKQGMRTLKPASEPVPAPANPVLQQLAGNDDLNVATIARQANKATGQAEFGDNEVVISLH